jgi:hypothetical protein
VRADIGAKGQQDGARAAAEIVDRLTAVRRRAAAAARPLHVTI